MDDDGGPRRGTTAFLLAQVGADAAARFAERIAELGVTPPQAGLLRAVAGDPGRSQQALAAQLGTPPSRLVALVDGLEDRGLLERRRNRDDRRLHAVHLTAEGRRMLHVIGQAGRAHDDAVLSVLDDEERAQLAALLARLADAAGLPPGVHPGFRHLSTGR
jgi:DNA-binding MarR family transcriptional regulator